MSRIRRRGLASSHRPPSLAEDLDIQMGPPLRRTSSDTADAPEFAELRALWNEHRAAYEPGTTWAEHFFDGRLSFLAARDAAVAVMNARHSASLGRPVG